MSFIWHVHDPKKVLKLARVSFMSLITSLTTAILVDGVIVWDTIWLWVKFFVETFYPWSAW